MKESTPEVIRDKELPQTMDFQWLRKEAIALTQQISGDSWTDYNVHDPGITMLEQFCYALTDISYRTNLDIETLLFHGGSKEEVIRSNALYPSAEVFVPGVLTLEDYRIRILDEFPDKIANCWVNQVKHHMKGFRGLLEIKLIPKNHLSPKAFDQLSEEVRELYSQHRNLCEDLDTVTILASEKITLTADIEIFQDQIPQDVLAEIFFQLENYFNAPVNFRSLEELVEAGVPHHEIYDISSFKHGFIDQNQLDGQRREFYVSKIADYILDVPGVRNLRHLEVFKDNIAVRGDIITVSEDNYLTLDLLNPDAEDPMAGFNVTLYKGGVQHNYHKESVLYTLTIKASKAHRNYEVLTTTEKYKEELSRTDQLTAYESIQRTFPSIYRVGNYQPVSEEGTQRIAQSTQLKSYLLFFDQIMANHLTQLAGVARLFSIAEPDVKRFKTYYAQNLVASAHDFDELLKKTIMPASQLRAKVALLSIKPAEQLSDRESMELDHLTRDLAQKKTFCLEQADNDFRKLIPLTEEDLRNHPLAGIEGLVEEVFAWQELMRRKEAAKDQAGPDTDVPLGIDPVDPPDDIDEINDMITAKTRLIIDLLFSEYMEQEHTMDFTETDLEAIMSNFDEAPERKDKILSHLLARFGEAFTNDFHLRFNTMFSDESEEVIRKRLIELKASLLREITSLNKDRAKGMVFQDAVAVSPLKRKVSLLLDIDHAPDQRLASPLGKVKVSIEKVTGEQVEKEVESEETPAHMRSAAPTRKVRFIVRNKEYFWYLFKYGLKEENYKVLFRDGEYSVFFQPPVPDGTSLLTAAGSKEGARKKIKQIITHFKKLNDHHEGFYVLEHLLLRSRADNKFHFYLQLDKKKTFKSVQMFEAEEQRDNALDTMLLACFEGNYKLVKKDGLFTVIIKSLTGKELARSLDRFDSETEAETFIDRAMVFYQEAKESDLLGSLIRLDDERIYHLKLLDENKETLFKSILPDKSHELEQQLNQFKNSLLMEGNYQIEKGEEGLLVKVNDYNGNAVFQSEQSFPNEDYANLFIEKCLDYFEQILTAYDFDDITTQQEVKATNAEDLNNQLSIVYPNWTARFNNEAFLQLFKQVLYQVVPAHLTVHLVGLRYREMKAFEDIYFQYKETFAEDSAIEGHDRNIVARDLLDFILSNQNN